MFAGGGAVRVADPPQETIQNRSRSPELQDHLDFPPAHSVAWLSASCTDREGRRPTRGEEQDITKQEETGVIETNDTAVPEQGVEERARRKGGQQSSARLSHCPIVKNIAVSP